MEEQQRGGASSEESRGGFAEDLDEGLHVGFVEADQPDGTPVNLETHTRHDRRDRAHVDLQQEEYTPDEIARMLGTSLEVVMHAIWAGELKADRKGHNVVCIKHEDVTDWLRRRGPGV